MSTSITPILTNADFVAYIESKNIRNFDMYKTYVLEAEDEKNKTTIASYKYTLMTSSPSKPNSKSSKAIAEAIEKVHKEVVRYSDEYNKILIATRDELNKGIDFHTTKVAGIMFGGIESRLNDYKTMADPSVVEQKDWNDVTITSILYGKLDPPSDKKKLDPDFLQNARHELGCNYVADFENLPEKALDGLLQCANDYNLAHATVYDVQGYGDYTSLTQWMQYLNDLTLLSPLMVKSNHTVLHDKSNNKESKLYLACIYFQALDIVDCLGAKTKGGTLPFKPQRWKKNSPFVATPQHHGTPQKQRARQQTSHPPSARHNSADQGTPQFHFSTAQHPNTPGQNPSGRYTSTPHQTHSGPFHPSPAYNFGQPGGYNNGATPHPTGYSFQQGPGYQGHTGAASNQQDGHYGQPGGYNNSGTPHPTGFSFHQDPCYHGHTGGASSQTDGQYGQPGGYNNSGTPHPPSSAPYHQDQQRGHSYGHTGSFFNPPDGHASHERPSYTNHRTTGGLFGGETPSSIPQPNFSSSPPLSNAHEHQEYEEYAESKQHDEYRPTTHDLKYDFEDTESHAPHPSEDID